ncbi:hypothetical protein FHT08_003716 [Xanthomonas campestris]|nr:hypothetical protein [Xanthomonas sp. CFBP 8151]
MSQPGLPKFPQEPSEDAAKTDVFGTLGIAPTLPLGDMVGPADMRRLIQRMAPLTKAVGAVTGPLFRFNNLMVHIDSQLAREPESQS